MDKNKEIFYKTLITYIKEKYSDDDTVSFLLNKIENSEDKIEIVNEDKIEKEEDFATFLKRENVGPELASKMIRLQENLKRSVEIIKGMNSNPNNKYKSTNVDFLDITKPINPYNKGFHNIVDNLKIVPDTELEMTEFIQKHSTIPDETVKPLNKATDLIKRVDSRYGAKIVNEDVRYNVEMTNSQIDLELTKDNVETLSSPWVNSNLLSDVNVVNEVEVKNIIEEINSNK